LIAVGLTLAAGGGTAVALPALPAVGQSSPPSSPIVLVKTAQVIDRGAVAKPAAYVVCGAGGQGDLQIQLTERSGKSIVTGYGIQDFTCTGQIETVRVPVPASGGERPWVAGTAFAQAQLFSCNFYCSSGAKTGNIKLVIKKK
jgi:hypothetical protein